MIDVNKISTVFGREGFREYINRQIEKKNLVRIKIRNTQNSDPNALIAKRYEKDVSNTIIAQNSQKSTPMAKKFTLSAKRGQICFLKQWHSISGSWSFGGRTISWRRGIAHKKRLDNRYA